jgi:protein-S-isoprenylcysteine O-methyltransferase Ste14
LTFRQILFRYRSYTPLPFLILMGWFAHPTVTTMLAGFCAVGLGEFLRAWGVFYAGSETRTTGDVGASRLVTSGPFARTRNPLYMGNIILYTGIGIMANALVPWLPAAALVWFVYQYTLIVKEEESFLAEKFGREYEEYSRAVPRFGFRVTPYSSPQPVKINWKAGWSSEARTLQAIAFVVAGIVAIWYFR